MPDNFNKNVTGKRIWASLIDIIIWLILLMVAMAYFGKYEMSADGSEMVKSVSLEGLPFILFLLAMSLYYIILEWQLGATLGKLALSLKVANMNGGKITLSQSITRNLFRAIDAFPYMAPYLVGLVFIATSENKQRLGDRIAHTLVVSS